MRKQADLDADRRKPRSFQGFLEEGQLKRLHRRHVQGAFVRSGASLVMWCMALSGFHLRILNDENLLGVSISVAFIVLMNFPTLWILKRMRRRSHFEAFSIFINALDVLAFTGIIYSVGGINDMVLSLTLAALITYVGVLAPPRVPFIIAGLSALSLSMMVFLEYGGIIPHLYPYVIEQLPLASQVLRLLCAVGLLLVVAFIASYTGSLVRRQKAKLRRQNADLEQSRQSLNEATEAMREKNIELQTALEGARSSDRAKSDFLANMSHELRTPLNHIIGFTELVLRKNVGGLTKLQEEYLNDVLQSSRHLLSLINDILDLSKVEAGKLELNLSEVNLHELIENSLLMIREKTIKHGIRVAYESGSLPGTIRADERKLKQILYNLLSNAVKFTPEGGEIRVTANAVSDNLDNLEKSPSEKPAIRDPRSAIRIGVADTGIGIAPENLERIFKPFEQIENSASRKYSGTGLGLSLTRSLVELHGGWVWAESEGEGKGSAFFFQIPADLVESSGP